ncbi:stage II sporulation protein P [Hominifimenecus sp. rT4P-3]|uniref:stage II sporulation protein P n=1 Tax=Hominifimenecus sp. rT4P-3 TaxID=3242979 RepID=UPI003DA560BC
MRIIILLLWILVSLFLSPASFVVNQEKTLPRLLMKAAESMVDPGFSMDYEAQMMAKEENLEMTGGLGADSIRGQIMEKGEMSGNGKESGETTESIEHISESSGEVPPETSEESSSSSGEAMDLPSEAVSAQALAEHFYSKEQLNDVQYLLDHVFCLDPTCAVGGDILNGEVFLNKDLKLTGTGEPQVLIYHTHSQEEYADSVPGDPSMTVQGVGDELARILTEKYGLSVLHNTTHFDMMEGKMERSRAYSYAKQEISQILDENPSIQVVIDLHRDGVPDDLHLATEVNGKPTAKIMFFNGVSQDLDGPIERLANPYREDNLAFSFQMYLQAKAAYPGFCRDIYLKGYRYNLHFRPRSVLLEVGAQNNTYEEAVNAMEPFADILTKVILPAKEQE